MVKAIVCAILAVLLVNNGVAARRELTQRASAVAVATSSGGPSRASATAKASGNSDAKAKSVADSNGCGSANAKTTSVATGGADVEGATVARSDDCAVVSGETNVRGDGDVKVSTALFVEGDKNDVIDIKVYRSRVEKGHKIQDIAVVIVKDFAKYKYSRVVDALLALAGDKKTFPLYEACLTLLLNERGCDNFKLIVVGSEERLIAFKVPTPVATCIYPPCSNFASGKLCCGSAQLAQDYCDCKDGKCAWKRPANRSVPYWICDACAEKVAVCVC